MLSYYFPICNNSFSGAGTRAEEKGRRKTQISPDSPSSCVPDFR